MDSTAFQFDLLAREVLSAAETEASESFAQGTPPLSPTEPADRRELSTILLLSQRIAELLEARVAQGTLEYGFQLRLAKAHALSLVDQMRDMLGNSE